MEENSIEGGDDMSTKIYNQDKMYAGNFSLNFFDGLPIGSISTYAGDDTPDGCLLCDGSAVSRTNYDELFAVIGTKFGDGDGAASFNLPNIIDPTTPAIKYLIKAKSGGSSINNATNTSRGFIRIATDDEAENSVLEDVAINPKQLKLALPKTTLRSKIYGTDDTGKQKLYDANSFKYGNWNYSNYSTREDYFKEKTTDTIKELVATHTFDLISFTTLSENPLGLGDYRDRWYMRLVTYNNSYARLIAYNRDTVDLIYTCLRATDGTWNQWCKCSINTVPDVAPTNLTVPDTIVGGDIWYQVKNGMVSIQCNGLKPTTTNLVSINFPAQYRPNGGQYCTVCSPYNDPAANALFYVDNQGVKLKASKANDNFYGSISYML